jgi:hypothetical protein
MLVCAVFHEDQPGGQTVRDSVYWKTTGGARMFRLCFELTPNDSNKSGINQFLEDAGVADLLSVNCERDPIDSFTLYSYQPNNFADGTYRRFTEAGVVDGWQEGHILMLLPNSLRRMHPPAPAVVDAVP